MGGNKLQVEVTNDDYIFRAFVEDVKPNGLELSFEKNWKAPCLVEFDKIRFPPGEDIAEFTRGQLVEIKMKGAVSKVTYWRKATLFKRDLVTAQWEVIFDDQDFDPKAAPSVVPICNIRHVNKKPTIGQSTLEKLEIEIPRHLREVAATAGIHDDFQKEVMADSCEFLSRLNILRLISKNGEVTRKKVDLLKVSHLNYLDSLRKRVSPPDEAPKFTEIFEVDAKLMGLALGKKYANIREARKIRDITSVKLIDDTLSIQICGKTAEAVKTARNMLEYREHHSTIPRYLAEELLEDDGKVIVEITEQSGLVRIECGEDDDDDENEDYPIVFVGNPPCIENAKTLLEYQLKLINRKLQKKQAAKSQSMILNDPNIIIERVPISKELKGLAIGKNNENLRKAQNIPGIVKIDAPKEMPMIIIHAKNEAAAQAARRLLEFDEDTVEVDRSLLGRVIGKGGVTIKKIESLSEGVRVRIPSVIADCDLTSDGKVIIKVSGPARKIANTIDLIKKASLGERL